MRRLSESPGLPCLGQPIYQAFCTVRHSVLPYSILSLSELRSTRLAVQAQRRFRMLHCEQKEEKSWCPSPHTSHNKNRSTASSLDSLRKLIGEFCGRVRGCRAACLPVKSTLQGTFGKACVPQTQSRVLWFNASVVKNDKRNQDTRPLPQPDPCQYRYHAL